MMEMNPNDTLKLGICIGVPSHCRGGNERADQTAMQGFEKSQPDVPLTLRRAKRIIFPYIDKCIAMTPKPKSLGHCGTYPDATGESRGRCRFRLTTGHGI
ncbi:hypothetical protein TNCV_845921 [Trichonephila clavipes]|nr:hypothetical protein TNCV_845921 [Trichonephila clavipes]